MRRGTSLFAVLVVLAFPASAGAFGPLSSFGQVGSGVGQLKSPAGMAIGPEGSAYVADSENNRVAVFSPDGNFVRAFGEGVVDGAEAPQVCTVATSCLSGKADGGAGAMDQPADVTFGPEGNLWVADRGNNRIDIYTSGGEFLRAFGKEVELSGTGQLCTQLSGCRAGAADGTAGSMSAPAGLALGPGDYFYVADSGDSRIAVFTPSGLFLRAFGKGVDPGGGDVCTIECKAGTVGAGAGEMDLPYDVVVSPGESVAVTDSNNDRIDVFTSAGAFVRSFGVAGDAAGALEEPTALTLDAGGNLYVADSGNNRVAEFTFAGTFIRAFGEGVLDGAETFQVCGSGAECQAGLAGTIFGSTPEPHGVAIDCRGAVYVSEEKETPSFARVERFGDVAVPPPCAQTEEAVKVTLRKVESVRRLKFRIKLNPKQGTATVIVSVAPPGGQLYLHGRGIRPATRKARRRACRKHRRGLETGCSTVFARMLVRPTRKTMEKLNATGEARVRMVLTYTPPEGDPATKRKAFTLRKVDD